MPVQLTAHKIKAIIRKELTNVGCFPKKLSIRTIIHMIKYEVRVTPVVNFDMVREIGAIVKQSEILNGTRIVVVENKISSSTDDHTMPSAMTIELSKYKSIDEMAVVASINRIENEDRIRGMWEEELKRKVDVFVDSYPWKNKTALRVDGYVQAAKICRKSGIVPHMGTCDVSAAFVGDMDHIFVDLKTRVLAEIPLTLYGSVLEHFTKLFLNTVRNGPGLKLNDSQLKTFFGEDDVLA